VRVRACEVILARANPEPTRVDVTLAVGPQPRPDVSRFLADLERVGTRLTADPELVASNGAGNGRA
jgi:hypothetical protein